MSGIHIYIYTYMNINTYRPGIPALECDVFASKKHNFFLIGTVALYRVLLDWFEVDLGFTELSSIQIDLCILCVFVLYSRVSLSSCPFSDILHCLLHAVMTLNHFLIVEGWRSLFRIKYLLQTVSQCVAVCGSV